MKSITSAPRRPPTYIRRPAKLTVPEPLARDTRMPEASRQHTMWDNTGPPSPARSRRTTKSSLHVVNGDEPEISPGIGITVQSPVSTSYNHIVLGNLSIFLLCSRSRLPLPIPS